MHGIWSLSGTPLEPGYARASLSLVWMVVLFLLLVWITKLDEGHPWPEFQRISAGIALLFCWYLLISIDLWLHQIALDIKFGYLLVLPLWEIPRVSSEIVLSWGTFHFVWRDLQGHLQSPKPVWHAGKAFQLLLRLLASYYIGLYVALVFCWEYAVDARVIEALATGRNSFELALAVVQFVFCLVIVAGTAWAGWFWQVKENRVPMQAWLQFGVSMLLWIRSFAELVVVASVASPVSASAFAADRALGRETAYGLFTVLYLTLVWKLSSTVATRDIWKPDTVIAQRDVMAWILEHVSHVMQQNSGEGPPEFTAVLRDCKQHFGDSEEVGYRSRTTQFIDDLEQRRPAL